MSIQILIVDDHGVIRAGLEALLSAETDLTVVGTAADGRTALKYVDALKPDIVLMDVSMPDISGIDLTKQIKAMFPHLHVIILTVHEDEILLQEAIQAGASGYIVKRAIGSELIDAIRTVWSGNMYVHPAMTRALLKELSPTPASQPSSNKPSIDLLTPREVEVLRYIAQGYTNRQIAQVLNISVRN